MHGKLYSQELVQVAAVAISALQDFHGYGANPTRLDEVGRIFDLVTTEIARQFAKWGEQHHSEKEWLAILVEEVGEMAQAINTAEGRG